MCSSPITLPEVCIGQKFTATLCSVAGTQLRYRTLWSCTRAKRLGAISLQLFNCLRMTEDHALLLWWYGVCILPVQQFVSFYFWFKVVNVFVCYVFNKCESMPSA